jgi:hypothetical protein
MFPKWLANFNPDDIDRSKVRIVTQFSVPIKFSAFDILPMLSLFHRKRFNLLKQGILIHGSQRITCSLWLLIDCRGTSLPMLSPIFRGRSFLPRSTVVFIPLNTQNIQSFVQDVQSRVCITTNFNFAARAWMSSGTKRFLHPMTAISTILRRVVRRYRHDHLVQNLAVVV